MSCGLSSCVDEDAGFGPGLETDLRGRMSRVAGDRGCRGGGRLGQRFGDSSPGVKCWLAPRSAEEEKGAATDRVTPREGQAEAEPAAWAAIWWTRGNQHAAPARAPASVHGELSVWTPTNPHPFHRCARAGDTCRGHGFPHRKRTTRRVSGRSRREDRPALCSGPRRPLC